MADADDIARHITTLTLNGVRAMSPRKTGATRKKVGGRP
jgi:hypothetical protein